MRIPACLPVLLLLGSASAFTHAQIYKCKEANGAILYSDSECDPDAETMAVMPKGSTRFQPETRWDPLVEDDPGTLSGQEQQLLRQLRAAQVEPGQSLHETTEVYALRRQILSLLKSVRRQKTDVQSRGVAPEDGEELITGPEK
ncbi:MAG: hypothetical protein V7642_611 [Burkholderiales bacterium]